MRIFKRFFKDVEILKIKTKQKIFFLLILFIFMVLIPLAAVRKNKNNTLEAVSLNKSQSIALHKNFFHKHSNFTVLDEHTNKILKIPEKEMVFSANETTVAFSDLNMQNITQNIMLNAAKTILPIIIYLLNFR